MLVDLPIKVHLAASSTHDSVLLFTNLSFNPSLCDGVWSQAEIFC